MKQKRINMRWLVVVMVAVMMVACGSNPNSNGVVDGNYPMPTMEEECAYYLYDVLMSPEGRAMTGVQLAVLSDTVLFFSWI